MKTSVFIATSLDGYIAREDGSIDWLTAFQGGGEDFGYREFIQTIDAVVMGRGTFETVMGFEGWTPGQPTIVLTSRPSPVPRHLGALVEMMSGTPAQVVDRLAARGMNHLYVDGGETITRFLRAGLIDEIIVSRIPVLIGSGIPLFGRLDHDVRLRHLSTREYPVGLVQSRYEVLR